MEIDFGPGFHAPAGRPVDTDAYERYIGRWSRLFVPALLAAAEVTVDDHVLDVATGPGEAAAMALSVVGGAVLMIGADISPTMVEAARMRLERLSFLPVVTDGQALPFKDGSFRRRAVPTRITVLPRPDAGTFGISASPSYRQTRRRMRALHSRSDTHVGRPCRRAEPLLPRSAGCAASGIRIGRRGAAGTYARHGKFL